MHLTLAWMLSLVVLAGCAVAPPAVDDNAALRRLLSDSDEARVARNPRIALFRGETRHADRFGDYLSDEYVDAERTAAHDDLARLARIDRGRLGPLERVAHDSFAWQRRNEAARLEPALAAVWRALPIDHLNGTHLRFAQASSGQGVAPFRTVADYERSLSRIDGFIVWLDRAEAQFRAGAARGIVHPRLVVEHLVAQFDRMAAQDVDESPFTQPLRQFPAAVPAAERERLQRAYAGMLRSRLKPALARMRDFLRDEYLPRARSSVGLAAVPGGAAYYRHLVQSETTIAMSADEIHQLGLSEVARIRGEMEGVRRAVGFAGTLPELFAQLRRDPRWQAASGQALGDGYRAIGERVRQAMPRLFSTMARTPLEIRPTPAQQAPTDAAARYVGGSVDGFRPGVFYYNTHDLPSRPIYTMEALYLHEALPGHHHQISLVRENTALPPSLRFGGPTAYAEGWGLYAESLGAELGLYADPYQRFGALGLEMLRALRLVVDTGLHRHGWTREHAIETMLANAPLGRTDVVAEVERYVADPGQALAYKIGQLTISRLRATAQAALGARFDVRAFHDQVLDTGALPLAVLEAKIDAWVEGQRR
jgi:uncharacterized protein (DUF885 family)